MTEIDDFDLKILRILQKDNYTPQREIAKQINLSAASVQRRIKKLLTKGYILSNTAVLDPMKLAMPITVFVHLELVNEKIELIDQIKKTFKEAPEVQQCYYVTGEIDFILIMVVPNMLYYEALTRKLFFGNDNIKRFKTFVAMDNVKMSLSIAV